MIFSNSLSNIFLNSKHFYTLILEHIIHPKIKQWNILLLLFAVKLDIDDWPLVRIPSPFLLCLTLPSAFYRSFNRSIDEKWITYFTFFNSTISIWVMISFKHSEMISFLSISNKIDEYLWLFLYILFHKKKKIFIPIFHYSIFCFFSLWIHKTIIKDWINKTNQRQIHSYITKRIKKRIIIQKIQMIDWKKRQDSENRFLFSSRLIRLT